LRDRGAWAELGTERAESTGAAGARAAVRGRRTV